MESSLRTDAPRRVPREWAQTHFVRAGCEHNPEGLKRLSGQAPAGSNAHSSHGTTSEDVEPQGWHQSWDKLPSRSVPHDNARCACLRTETGNAQSSPDLRSGIRRFRRFVQTWCLELFRSKDSDR